jgi:hypothetical protein
LQQTMALSREHAIEVIPKRDDCRVVRHENHIALRRLAGTSRAPISARPRPSLAELLAPSA